MEGDEQLPPSSSPEQEENNVEEEQGEWMDDNHDGANRARFHSEEEEEAATLPPLPRREEPTLKERLVERERQARVETERARLKRQFALSANGGAGGAPGDTMHRENGSVEGTVGEESSVAAPPTDDDRGEPNDNDDDRKQLGYVMERFLRGDVEEEEEQVEKPKPEPGVLMERFLAEPVVVEQQDTTADTGVEQVEDDAKMSAQEDIMMNAPDVSLQHDRVEEDDTALPLPPPITATGRVGSRDDSELEATAGSIRSYSTMTNASLAPVNTIDVDLPPEEAPVHEADHGSREPDSSYQDEPSSEISLHESSSEEPRVFRLTEAEIQEMAAIEEASIGNAPPSERDDTFSESSLVGDLVGDLGGPRGLDPVGDFSAGTTTTALESASITSAGGDLSERSAAIEIETQSVDAIETASVSSHLVVSPGASSEGSVSITACPPSVTGVVEEPSVLGPDEEVVALPHNDMEGSAVLEMLSFEQDPHNDTNNTSLECAPSFEDAGGPLDVEAAATANAGVSNRQLRPGRARLPPDTPETPVGRQSNAAQKKVHIMLEGFDYDRDALDHTPHSRGMDSYNELPGDDPWSPEMNMSPLQSAGIIPASRAAAAPEYPRFETEGVTSGEGVQMAAASYGTIEARGREGSSPSDDLRLDSRFKTHAGGRGSETLPLVDRHINDDDMDQNEGHISEMKHADLKHAVSNIFSSLRSDSTTTVEAVNTDSEQYLATGIFKRAFPERFFALIVTLIVEIPVLLMISGGSDRLCMLVGRRRYQLMMGFLPLSSAISGNVGLQASTLTTRAVSHDHVTKSSYVVWLGTEVAAAAFLGLGMGSVLGTYAYIVSGMDYAFGLTIFMAQFVSIVTAGLTGTLAPLIFTFIFHRDSALYGGPLETAIQDIVGSFAMVVLSYRLLVFFGPMEITPDDICGQQQ